MMFRELFSNIQVPSLVGISAVAAALICLWPLAIYFRRWWRKPYNKPERVLRKLQRSFRLTQADKRHLNSLLGSNREPVFACQFLLDPSRWPIDQSAEPTKKLYLKVFDHP